MRWPTTCPAPPGAVVATGQAAFADRAPQHVPHLRLASPRLAGQPALGVRLSLRLELDADDAETRVRAVVQVHDTAGGHRVADAEALWRAVPSPGALDATRQMESLLALRRAARAWPPLARLLEEPSHPGALDLDEEEIDELLGDAVARLARVDCAVHWPRDLIRALIGRTVIAPRPKAVAGRSVAGEALVCALSGSAQIGEERVEVHPTGWLADLRSALTSTAHPDVVVPAGLKAELRHYQRRGLAC
ncbi:hypothetical protein [Streptomyces sp. NBC_01601]|uniref:hypothetical protein n=1 Tax=Streptomyces sp. NBC_01601 TaxID=2975892 RepID=UPI002E2929CA|nr:hypothetical protein [Streptomyces sp. NBC_01601]